MPVDGPNQKFSYADLVALAKQAGLDDAKARIAAAVALAESGGSSGNHNPNAFTGDNSYGLWQINMLGSLGPGRRSSFGIPNNEALYDPLTNAKAMAKISGNGSSFSAWSTYLNNAYTQYLGDNSGVSTRDNNSGGTGISTGTAPGVAPGSGSLPNKMPANWLEWGGWIGAHMWQITFVFVGGVMIITGVAMYFRHDIGADIASALKRSEVAT